MLFTEIHLSQPDYFKVYLSPTLVVWVTLIAWLIIQLIIKWNTEFQFEWSLFVCSPSQWVMSYVNVELCFTVFESLFLKVKCVSCYDSRLYCEVKTTFLTLGGERNPFVFLIFGIWTTFLLNMNPPLGQKAVNEKAFWCLYILTAVTTAHHSFEDVLKSFRLFGFKDAHFKLNWNI